jgi:ABC-2 type transport system permease protein
MKKTSGKLKEYLRITWAITAKDIVDALKNKITLGVILPALFVVVAYRMLPSLFLGDEQPNLLLYDAGESSLVTALEESIAFKLHVYPTEELMQGDLAEGILPELGLVIPADYNQVLAEGGEPILDGYMLNWVSEKKSSELKRLAEQEILELTGNQVQIQTEGNVAYTRAESFGFGWLNSLGLVVLLTMIGVSLAPNIMLEEKQTKTIDVLLVSPANPSQVVIGKALTGLFFCLLCVFAALIINYALVTHWGIAILATLIGSAFAVALGLLLGTTFETRQQLTLWAWVLIIPLFVPMMLGILADILPGGVISVFQWIPTVALTKVFRVSFAANAPFDVFGPQLALVLAYTIAVLGLVTWVVRRSDR